MKESQTMSRILVTGGTGVLGREVVKQLSSTSHSVRLMSRQSRSANAPANVEWATANLETGEGVKEAVAGVDVIIHAASNARQNTYQADVEGTRRLIEAAGGAKISHFIYVSIVGIERVPYPYYKLKVQAEEVVNAAGVPYSILRATQFHEFIDFLLHMADRLGPFIALPTDFQCQPVDVSEVAARLCEVANSKPGGLLPDVGGPEVLRVREIARLWLEKRHVRKIVMPLPLPGKAAYGYRHGFHTCPDQRVGKISWAQWLDRTYGSLRQPTGTQSYSLTTNQKG